MYDVIVCYDISDDDNRRALFDYLENYGASHIQDSVWILKGVQDPPATIFNTLKSQLMPIGERDKLFVGNLSHSL